MVSLIRETPLGGPSEDPQTAIALVTTLLLPELLFTIRLVADGHLSWCIVHPTG